MNFGRRSSEKCAAAPTMWASTTFTGGNRADDWLQEAAARFRSAITLQIPVGYQDANGFHQGIPCRAGSRPRREAEADTF